MSSIDLTQLSKIINLERSKFRGYVLTIFGCFYRIGTGLRTSLYALKDSPGPGNYNLGPGEHGPKWGFGSGMRGKLENSEDPGNSPHRILFFSRFIINKVMTLFLLGWYWIGPGTYNIPAFFADVPKFMMSSNPKIHYPWRRDLNLGEEKQAKREKGNYHKLLLKRVQR